MHIFCITKVNKMKVQTVDTDGGRVGITLDDIPDSIPITIDEKGQKIVSKKSIKTISIDVEYLEEPCIQIYNPHVIPDPASIEGHKKIGIIHGSNDTEVSVFLSLRFAQTFTIPKSLQISAEGLLRKKLAIINIEPIIRNICKV